MSSIGPDSQAESVPDINPNITTRRGANPAPIGMEVGVEDNRMPPVGIRDFYRQRLGLTAAQTQAMIDAGYSTVDELPFITEETPTDINVIGPSKTTLKNYAIFVQDAVDNGDSGETLTRIDRMGLLRYRSGRQRAEREEEISVRSGRSGATEDGDRNITINLPDEWAERDTRARRESAESTTKIIQAIQANKKPQKKWREDYKNNKEFPTFDGHITKWDRWKPKLLGYLGSNNLMSLLQPAASRYSANYDPDDDEKNEWLYFMFKSNLSRDAVVVLNTMPRDPTTRETIPDGREAWKRITGWYEGTSAQTARRRYAFEKIRTLELGGTMRAGSYLSNMTDMFQLLEEQGEVMSDNQKIDMILGGIKDKRYAMTKEIMNDNINITYTEVLEKIRRHDLSLQIKEGEQTERKANAGRRGGGRGGGRGGM